MSWWDSGSEVLGDGPADLLRAAWRRVLLGRESRAQGRPSLEDLLAAFAASLGRADTDPHCLRLVLRRMQGEPMVVECREGGPGDLREAFDAVLPEIASDYRLAIGRAPTPSELAKTMQFLLAPNPQDYLSDGAGDLSWGSSRLIGEPAPAPAADPGGG